MTSSEKRINIVNSSRSISVDLAGVVLAESSDFLLLLETGCRRRYYLPPTSVKRKYLSKSDTETYCPYKGKANYWNVTIDGKKYENLIWEYANPIAESAQIAGHLCFDNEKVHIHLGAGGGEDSEDE